MTANSRRWVAESAERCNTAKDVNERSDSSTGLASTADPVDEPMPQQPSATASVEVSSTEVLITTQEMVFSTAAAVGVRRKNIAGRLVDIVRRMFATSTDASRPRPQYYPMRYGFLENALMAREMDRL